MQNQFYFLYFFLLVLFSFSNFSLLIFASFSFHTNKLVAAGKRQPGLTNSKKKTQFTFLTFSCCHANSFFFSFFLQYLIENRKICYRGCMMKENVAREFVIFHKQFLIIKRSCTTIINHSLARLSNAEQADFSF